METFWEPNGHAPHPVKYESDAAVAGFPYCTESSLNFSTSGAPYSEDDAEYSAGRRNKTSRQDPLSHRIIEKRRRDRMNSCLADLSRLIPPQYQRKGRGRIEKTEIIEMAIRHLKHLQSECAHKEYEYKVGYADCMKEAAKFLYESHMQECCYRLIAHLDEVMKSDCFKSRCNLETTSASSGSPAQNNFHQTNLAVPTPQLRDILTSDIEHSNDHSDIKDLSFRSHHSDLHDNDHRSNNNNNNHNHNHNNNNNSNNNNNQISHQAPVITSTAPSSIQHDDFDSSRELPHHENGLSSSPPISSSVIPNISSNTISNTNNSNNNNNNQSSIIQQHQQQQQQQQQNHSTESILKSVRLRNLSESSHDIEHNNNNYKYKNHIKERFNQDSHLNHHDESTSDHSITISESPINHQLQIQINNNNSNEIKPQLTTIQQNIKPEIQELGVMLYKKRKLDINSIHEHQKHIIDAQLASRNSIQQKQDHNINNNNNINNNSNLTEDIKVEISQLNSTKLLNGGCGVNGPNTITAAAAAARHLNLTNDRHISVPIFVLHGQGTYYVPLNIDYESLLPYLNGIDLFDKNYCPLPMLHPVNIHVNFSFPNAIAAAAAAAATSLTKSVAANSLLQPHLLTRSKLENIANGW